MDDMEKVAAEFWRYLFAKAWFKGGNLETPSRLRLKAELQRGKRVFSGVIGEIVIDPKASPIIQNDAVDRNFLDAIYGRDDAIEMDAGDLNMYRQFVLHGKGSLPHFSEPEDLSVEFRPTKR